MGRGDNRRSWKMRRRRSQTKHKARLNRWRLEQPTKPVPGASPTPRQPERAPPPLGDGPAWLTRVEYLAKCGAMIGARHAPQRHYVSRTVAHLGLGIDAEVGGSMRVHLFSDDATVAAWLSALESAPGPEPQLAQATSRVGPNGERWYYGFSWNGIPERNYALDYPRAEAFVAFLREVALRQDVRF